MINKILLASFFVFTTSIFAQEGTASPYSFYGIGDVRFKGTIDTRSMGGLGILPDSIHINLQNPASLSSLKLTTLSIGTTYSSVTLSNNSVSEKASRTGIDYLAVGIPVGKLGFAFGLMPYSSTGYKVRNVLSDRIATFTGTGSLNRAFLSAGYQLNKKLSIGANFNYNFGLKETNATESIPGVQYNSRELNNSEFSGISFNTGAIYQTKFKKYDLISSVTYTPSSILKSNNTSSLAAVITTFSGVQRPIDGTVREIIVPDTDLKLPSKIAFGSGIGLVKKWFVGFETTFQQAGDFADKYSIAKNVQFSSATKLSLGGYYIPNYNSFSSYFKKVTYRAGFRHENTGLTINGQDINDTAATLGFGLPVGGSFSNLNLGFELGKRGTTNSGLIKENYLNVSIGFSFNDKWFTKRKYD